jgi:O-antigen ligase
VAVQLLAPPRRLASRGVLSLRAVPNDGKLGLMAGVVASGLAAALISTGRTVTVAVIGGILLLLAMAVIPDLAIYLLAIVLPVSQTAFTASLITPKRLALFIVACLIGPMIARLLIRPTIRAVALGTALVCYFVISMALVGGSGLNASVRTVLTVAVPILFIPLIAGASEATRRAVVLFCITMAFLAIPEVLKSESSLASSGNVTAGIGAQIAAGQTGAVNHNVQGALFVVALAAVLAMFPRTQHGKARLCLAVLIAAEATGVIYSFSRASYFGAIAVIAVFAVRRSFRSLIGAAIALGCLLPLLPAAVTARFTSATSPNSLNISSNVRLDLWISALRMFDAHPITGVGYQNFASQLPAYFGGAYKTVPLNFQDFSYAHNTFLSILAETGLIGAFLVGALITMGWRRAQSTAGSDDWAGESALLALVGIGVCSIFGEPLFDPAVLAVLLLTVLAAPEARAALQRDRVRSIPAGSAGA